MIYILKIQHFGETSLTYNSVGALSSLFTIFLINKSKKKKNFQTNRTIGVQALILFIS